MANPRLRADSWPRSGGITGPVALARQRSAEVRPALLSHFAKRPAARDCACRGAGGNAAISSFLRAARTGFSGDDRGGAFFKGRRMAGNPEAARGATNPRNGTRGGSDAEKTRP